jgi:phospholipid/cholesterol/gamma-HCH transport system substrate-binding protein
MPPARKTIGVSELRVGLLVLISIVILIFLILNATGDINPFARKLHLKAQFANADGLREGSEVRLAGVRVGKVEEVVLLPPPDTDDPKAPRIEARLSIDGKIDGRAANERIRQDSLAQLTAPGLLGNEKIINVTPGTAAAAPVPENYTLATSSANTFTDLASSGNDLVQRLTKVSDQVNEITKKINEGQGTLGRIVNDEALYNNLNATIRDTQDVIRQIKAGEGSAGRFVNDPALYNNLNDTVVQLQAIATDLRAGRGTAGKLFTDEALYNDARSAISRLNETADRINLIVGDIRAGKGTAGKLITDEAIYNDARAAIARFNTTAERIDNVVASAQRGEGTVGKLLTDDQLYNNVNQLSSEGVKLIYDFRQNPKKYLTVKFELF